MLKCFESFVILIKLVWDFNLLAYFIWISDGHDST